MKTASLIGRAKLAEIAWFPILIFALLLSGCASFEAGGNVQRGRYALLRGDSKLAVDHFQRASEIDAKYLAYVGPMKEGVWTYLGRAYYDSGDYKSALAALEQARKSYPDDVFAPLYFGLALAKDGNRQRAVKEIHAGLTRMNDSLEDIQRYGSNREYWDPQDFISSRIQKDLARIDGNEFNWTELIASAEQIGIDLEGEIDIVKREIRRDRADGRDRDSRGN